MEYYFTKNFDGAVIILNSWLPLCSIMNDKLAGIDNYIYVIGLVGLVGLLAGFGASELTSSQETVEDVPGPDYFVTQGVFHGNAYEYGFNEKPRLNSPMRIRAMASPSRVTNNFVETNASMADLWFFKAGEAFSREPDARILPYQVNVEDEFLGIYVSNTSDIREPEDLDGKTVTMPQIDWHLAETSLMILEEEYGVEMEKTDRTHKGVSQPRAPVEVLENGSADAVVVTGIKRLGDNHSMRPVYYPYKDLKEKFGDAALPTFFIVKDSSPESIEKGVEMVKALQKSANVAQNEPDRFMKIFKICNEFLIQNGRDEIEPMTPGAEDQLQYMMDLARDENMTEYNVDLSRRLVRN